jgi:urease accessory protein
MNRVLGLSTALALILLSNVAFGHEGEGTVGGFVSGFLHPIGGPDHLIAMVGIGIWGALLGAPAIWLLPVAFPLMMAAGGALGISGVPVPMVEQLIALSGLVIGAAIAINRRWPLPAALILVLIFAIAHGHAHGAELPEAADPLGYSVGFVLATGLMHVVGIGIGSLRDKSLMAVRIIGGLIAAGGLYFLVA